jgi:hypothetical protein
LRKVADGYTLEVLPEIHQGQQCAEDASFQFVGQAQVAADPRKEQGAFTDVLSHLRLALCGSPAQDNLAMDLRAGLLDAGCEVIDAEPHGIELHWDREVATVTTKLMAVGLAHFGSLLRFCAMGVPKLAAGKGCNQHKWRSAEGIPQSQTRD